MLVSGDTPAFTESYDSKIVSPPAKTLTPAGVVNDGNSGNNYAVTFVANNTGVINKRPLIVTAAGVNKIYEIGRAHV